MKLWDYLENRLKSVNERFELDVKPKISNDWKITIFDDLNNKAVTNLQISPEFINDDKINEIVSNYKVKKLITGKFIIINENLIPSFLNLIVKSLIASDDESVKKATTTTATSGGQNINLIPQKYTVVQLPFLLVDEKIELTIKKNILALTPERIALCNKIDNILKMGAKKEG